MTRPQEPELDDLFRELIIDHYRRPRNYRSLLQPTLRLEGINPVCGDEVILTVAIEDGVIEALGFGGRGCSISQASASMMSDEVEGRPISEALAVADRFRAMMVEGGAPDGLGDLEALQGVANYPVRVKCALLAWNVLRQGLEPLLDEHKEVGDG